MMKKEHKIALACGGAAILGGVIGAWFIKNNINNDIYHTQMELERELEHARSMVRDISGQVDTAVRSVYNGEAKKLFEARLNDISDDQIERLAEKMVKGEVNNIVTKVANNAVTNAINKINVKDMVQDYIEDNSVYFDRKITKTIRDMFDDDFQSEITSAIKEKIKEA